MADTFATSFGVLNYSGMLFNKGNVRTPLSSIIGSKAKTTNHVEFVTGQEYTSNGNGSQPAMADKYGVSVPQLCIRYTLQLGAISLPKTGNPAHMKTNADVDFEISAEDMEVLKHFKKIESYGANSGFPVYGGRL